jgi:2-keto-4-pentenoate hydratase/2-oxohepta-3-ene-1,7-dioic acid hydratase in catechol pathway
MGCLGGKKKEFVRMKLARFGEKGSEVPSLVTDDGVFDLRGIVADVDAAALSPDGLARIRAARDLPVLDTGGLRIGSPIARPGAVYCIGMNYAAHAAESGSAPPDRPVLFLKPPNTVGGPHDPVDLPRGSTATDWEVELGLVIGSRAHYLASAEEARSVIAGYVAVNDLSERDAQLGQPGGQWAKGKAAPGFTPVGPWFVTADELDPGRLGLRSWVNGEPRQDSTTADLIFDVAEIVRDLSQFLELEPGDLVLTGTPEGVALSGRFPYLREGDIVEIEIDGLGRQRQRMGRA